MSKSTKKLIELRLSSMSALIPKSDKIFATNKQNKQNKRPFFENCPRKNHQCTCVNVMTDDGFEDLTITIETENVPAGTEFQKL